MAGNSTIEHADKLDMRMDEIEDGSDIAVHSTNLEVSKETYSISWRTFGQFIALSSAWETPTFSITGPNFSIGYVVAEYPASAANASWIANAPIFCLLALPSIIGSAGDRYGKRWFILGGGFVAMIGAIISGVATSLEMVIGGQTLTGIGWQL